MVMCDEHEVIFHGTDNGFSKGSLISICQEQHQVDDNFGFLLPAYKDMIGTPYRFNRLAMFSLSRTEILDFVFYVYNCSHASRRKDSD